MNEFKPGELIDVTMRCLRIESIDDVGIAQCSMLTHAWRPTINLRADGVEVERVAPEEWPPRHGDLWRDASATLWAGMAITTDPDADGPYVLLMPLRSDMRHTYDPDVVLQDRGPVALLHRQPSGERGA